MTYAEKVYAGVLGKIIGVYLGRPFESWSHAEIQRRLGDITGYVHDRLDQPLVVTDDDISGTLVFPRTIRDYGYDPDVTPRQVGQTWLNYLVPERSVLWWGGVGNSTEHTAYLRLTQGLLPPETGAIAANGKVVAEQVGAQIFVEGWAMLCPGDPARAADLAARAASVSHDGEALHGARVVAALVAGAFTESNVDSLLDAAVAQIPADSLIAQVIADVREWHAAEPDWKRTFARIDERYGYHRYGGNCHIVPNHAVVISAILYGAGDFDRAMTVVTTSGWDTDSNGGNVGAIMGVLCGLDGIGPQWREPVADRLYLPTADGGSAVTDAATEAVRLLRTAAGGDYDAPKGGARFHFAFPGSVQGFTGDVAHDRGRLLVRGGQATTPTFIVPADIGMTGYDLHAAPTLYPGQRVSAVVVAAAPTTCRMVAHVYDDGDALVEVGSEPTEVSGETALAWTVPDLAGRPVVDVGIETSGPVQLDRLDWAGTPTVTFTRAAGTMWRRAWVSAVDKFDRMWPEPFRLIVNAGTGLVITGTRDWTDYTVSADVTPHLARAAGVAARVQGLRRYYALQLVERRAVQLVRELDGPTVLAEAPLSWEFGETYELALTVRGTRIVGTVNGTTAFDLSDENDSLDCGGVALLCTEGRTATQRVRVEPAGAAPPS